VGWMKDEFDIAGIPFDRRGAVMDEYLAALRVLFEGEGEYHGRSISFPPLIFEPKPVQRPMPIYIGSGAGPAALRRIARFGQGWTPIGLSAEEVAAAAGTASRHRGHVGFGGLRHQVQPGHRRRARGHAAFRRHRDDPGRGPVRAGQFRARTRGRPSTRSATISRMISEDPP
jgi:alkanesulfonate monooxygenase SsuD/methylene tetrahydromethanopterin reductase-like flavin-dependent oxidoreductase (luciferase family)